MLCLVCGIELEPTHPELCPTQPNEGVMISTAGNYGSRVWDSMDGYVLAVVICDDCLVKAADMGRVQLDRHYIPVQTDMLYDPAQYCKSIVGSLRVQDFELRDWDSKQPNPLPFARYLPLIQVLDIFDHRGYAWNLERWHFEEAYKEDSKYHIEQHEKWKSS